MIEDEASGYEDEDESEDGGLEDDEANEDEDEDEDATSSSEEDESARKRKGKRKPGRKVMVTAKINGKSLDHHEDGESENEDGKKEKKGHELWRPGVKSKLAPGEEIFIPLPKARGPGKTPYQDHTVHPNTMTFLGELKRNNEREWLKSKSLGIFFNSRFPLVEVDEVREETIRKETNRNH